MAEGKRPRSQG